MIKAELNEQINSMTDEESGADEADIRAGVASKATSIEEVRKRTGTSPMSPEEFDRHFGSLPTDGEG